MVGEFQNQYGGYGGGYGQDILLSPSVPAQPKKPKGVMIGLVMIGILAIVAVGGVVFMSMTETNEVAEQETEEVESETTDNTENENENENNTTDTTSPKDYLYISDWGYKIKIPKDLKITSYTYIDGTLCVNGVKNRTYEVLPNFVNIQYNRLGCIYRTLKNAEISTPEGENYESEQPAEESTFTKGDYDYWFISPAALYTQTITEAEWEIESSKLIREMLTTPGNYTNI